MSLPHALLGLLNYRPTTGYQLKTAFKEAIYFFWDATLPQIYRTLNQMEEKGWLTAETKPQAGKPSRKVYKITDHGLKEFRRWLEEPPEVPQPRNPLMLKVFFGNQMDKDQLAVHLQQTIKSYAHLLQKYEKEVKPVMQRYAAITRAPSDAKYWACTLEFGQMQAQMAIDWCENLLKALNRKTNSNKTQKRVTRQ